MNFSSISSRALELRYRDERFLVNPSVHHVGILFSRLNKNICDLDDYAILSEVGDLFVRREACIGRALEYACRFWTKHLARIPGNGPHVKRMREAIDEFFVMRHDQSVRKGRCCRYQRFV